ncbi:hypothetical protein [Cellulomonas humilata]|nr:hypothetical protein [Cellulomonas humilata]
MTTTDEYIATFPDEVRPILTEVAEALRRAELVERIAVALRAQHP